MSNPPRTPAPFFEIHALGQLESGKFPGTDNIYCQYRFVHGEDWKVIAGLDDGITQTAALGTGSDDLLVWNFPIDITFKSTNVFGWPQLVVTVYGHDALGRNVILGYSSVHIPTSSGQHTVYARCFRPVSSSLLQQFLGFLRANPPEYINVAQPSRSVGRDVTRVKSKGVIKITLNVVARNLTECGYASTS
mmetsp:Transcript_72821/g.171270  ORF Transcript_72821/g.171270 Transcript_72821/m.171270 type:complete len:191 (-) Transcript_72821:51-623(-)|eukprot:CAMPEP_0175932198 /NCGR_PEP_ID=MMETSP0108-20121206/19264_1 /TAXON_ID=195067 ORGANISM="Goniomonas pacifica, Strain CCMP1869" /NCGR_SAMPLE_ID=MMETSP0108 /ASSEMBLY_ACC=CAM_ASM_000204 /LENGTH=190 /DNA_ID=CAMNT_0017255825 /DNA_START=1 /DNA_END=573 /DNA_ORIENTATION=-